MFVDKRHAVLELGRDLAGLVQVRAPHGAGQPVVGVVGDADRVVDVLGLVDDRDRSEDLVAAHVGLRVDVGEQGRLHVGAVAVDLCAADAHRGVAVLARLLQTLDDLVAGLDGRQRSDVGVVVVVGADRELADLLLQGVHGAVVEVLEHDEALWGVAGLAGVVHADGQELVEHPVEVLVVDDQEGVVAAELEHGLLVVLAGGLGHGGAGALGTGQGDALDAGVGDEVVHLGAGGVDVDVGVLRQARFFKQVLASLGGQRADGGVLEHDRVSQQQVRGSEAGDLVVGEVPGHDAQQRPQRFLAHEGAVDALGGQLLVGEQLVGVLGVPAVDVGDDADLGLGPAGQLAHFAADVVG